jgi:predicted HicB family RNase H-like nuclease
MAKKRTPPSSKEPAPEKELRAVRLELNDADHEALRIEAAKQDVSLGELARIAVREYLKGKK